jgi:hypothetical protein
MIGLSPRGRRLLDELLASIGQIRPGVPATYLGYKQIHDALGLVQLPHVGYGDSLKMQGLSDLAEWTKIHQLPAITRTIVDQ